jgi:hypothetical protein
LPKGGLAVKRNRRFHGRKINRSTSDVNLPKALREAV